MDTHATPRGGSRADGPLLARPPTEAEHQAAQDAAIQRIAALERQNADLLAAIRTMQVVARTVIARTGAPAADKGA